MKSIPHILLLGLEVFILISPLAKYVKWRKHTICLKNSTFHNHSSSMHLSLVRIKKRHAITYYQKTSLTLCSRYSARVTTTTWSNSHGYRTNLPVNFKSCLLQAEILTCSYTLVEKSHYTSRIFNDMCPDVAPVIICCAPKGLSSPAAAAGHMCCCFLGEF
jgi:hypothetical protein